MRKFKKIAALSVVGAMCLSALPVLADSENNIYIDTYLSDDTPVSTVFSGEMIKTVVSVEDFDECFGYDVIMAFDPEIITLYNTGGSAQTRNTRFSNIATVGTEFAVLNNQANSGAYVTDGILMYAMAAPNNTTTTVYLSDKRAFITYTAQVNDLEAGQTGDASINFAGSDKWDTVFELAGYDMEKANPTGSQFVSAGGQLLDTSIGSNSVTALRAPDAPDALAWNGETAEWEAPGTGCRGYNITLYKDGTQIDTISDYSETSYDFTAALFNNGAGDYTFGVEAIGGTYNSSEAIVEDPYTVDDKPVNLAWSGTDFGTATWDAPALDNGTTHVYSYNVTLYKGVEVVASHNGISGTSYDFYTDMFNNGAGVYTFGVESVAVSDPSEEVISADNITVDDRASDLAWAAEERDYTASWTAPQLNDETHSYTYNLVLMKNGSQVAVVNGVSATSYNFVNQITTEGAGSYTYSVVAVGGNGTLSEPVTISEAKEVTKIPMASTGFTYDPATDTLSWNAVEHASGYTVTIKDKQTDETTDIPLGSDVTTYSPVTGGAIGDYEFTVSAVSENANTYQANYETPYEYSTGSRVSGNIRFVFKAATSAVSAAFMPTITLTDTTDSTRTFSARAVKGEDDYSFAVDGVEAGTYTVKLSGDAIVERTISQRSGKTVTPLTITVGEASEVYEISQGSGIGLYIGDVAGNNNAINIMDVSTIIFAYGAQDRPDLDYLGVDGQINEELTAVLGVYGKTDSFYTTDEIFNDYQGFDD